MAGMAAMTMPALWDAGVLRGYPSVLNILSARVRVRQHARTRLMGSLMG
jgi:hypothetical protein